MRTALLVALLAGCNGATTPGPISSGSDAGARADSGPTSGGTRVTLANVTVAGGLALRWVAFNDGDGPWQPLPGPGPAYTFEARTGRYGLAFVCAARLWRGEVIHATVAELPALTVDCGQASRPASRRVSGRASGLPAGSAVWVQIAGGFRELPPSATDYFIDAPAGTWDLGMFASAQGKATHAFVRRDLVIGADVMVDVDFSAEGVALVRQPLHVAGAPAGPAQWSTGTTLATAHDTFTWGDQDGTLPASYAALPAKVLGPQEYQQLETGVTEGQPEAQQIRGVMRVFREPPALDLALPAPFSSPRVTATRTASGLRPRVTFEHHPEALYYQLVAYQQIGMAEAGWLAIVSKGWLGEATAYELPDWSAVPGFDAGLPGAGLFGETDAVVSNRDFARTINDDPATRDGSELKYARLSFVLDEP